MAPGSANEQQPVTFRGRAGVCEKIVTQPREEGCDLAELGAERERQMSGNEGADAGVWRCSGGADYPIGT